MLSVRGLRAGYGRVLVLEGVDLEVERGQLLCLMGRNGVGKTTLLAAIAGLRRPWSGVIQVDGRDLAGLSPAQRTRMGIGYVPQGQVAFPHLTAKENLLVALEASGRRGGGLDDALDMFPRLRPLLGRPAGLLSGGERQQLAMARALVAQPRLLLLDEPTEGIQPSIILEIEQSIQALRRAAGLTILLVEQYLEFALRLADRYAVMEAGRIVAAGATADAEPDALHRLLAV
ncbi:MAG: ATP-binding cassette domain-containing protein [Egibacteraceae bacterium]